MPSHRTLRVAEAIREVVSSAILFEVSDPRVQGVTVLNVEVTGDLRNATVFVTIMGSELSQKQAMKGLTSAAGFLQSKVAARLQTRFTPALTFKRDTGVKKQLEMSRLIDDVMGRTPSDSETADSIRPSDSPVTDDIDEEDEFETEDEDD